MNTSKISIFIVDNYPLKRHALRGSVLIEKDMEIVGAASDDATAIADIHNLQPNLVILRIVQPLAIAADFIRLLTKTFPYIYILAFSTIEKEEVIFEVVQAGARGYLTADVQQDELNQAIRAVSAGKSYFSDRIMEKLISGVRQNFVTGGLNKALTALTKRV